MDAGTNRNRRSADATGCRLAVGHSLGRSEYYRGSGGIAGDGVYCGSRVLDGTEVVPSSEEGCGKLMDPWTVQDVASVVQTLAAVQEAMGGLLIALYVIAGIMFVSLGYRIASDFGVRRTAWINTNG
jgi:hypothetical protein